MEPDTTRDTFNLAIRSAVRLDALEARLARVEREIGIQDRIITELRRDLALNRYDPAKPLPGTVAK